MATLTPKPNATWPCQRHLEKKRNETASRARHSALLVARSNSASLVAEVHGIDYEDDGAERLSRLIFMCLAFARICSNFEATRPSCLTRSAAEGHS